MGGGGGGGGQKAQPTLSPSTFLQSWHNPLNTQTGDKRADVSVALNKAFVFAESERVLCPSTPIGQLVSVCSLLEHSVQLNVPWTHSSHRN